MHTVLISSYNYFVTTGSLVIGSLKINVKRKARVETNPGIERNKTVVQKNRVEALDSD